MRIVFVRHGHPNYKDDCLTELGHVHAEAAARRLMDEGITEIHSSSCGRAAETAEHTAAHLKLPVTQHDFMREIRWGALPGEEIPHNGHPWQVAHDTALAGGDLMCENWRETEPYCRSLVCQYVDVVEEGIDKWLAGLGYEREGRYYRVKGTDTDRTVAMFSHGGSSTAALAHMLNVPFPYLCETMQPDFTAITVVKFPDEMGILAAPQIEIANDSRHIQGGDIVISN